MTQGHSLSYLGWKPAFASHLFQAGYTEIPVGRLARVVRSTHNMADLLFANAQLTTAWVPAKHRQAGMLVAGDWVVTDAEPKSDFLPEQETNLTPAEQNSGSDHNNLAVEFVLPRRTEIARKQSAGRKSHSSVANQQVLAANIDLIGIVMACNQDFNLNRLERYLIWLAPFDVQALLILSKADLVLDPQSFLAQVRARNRNLPVETVSVQSGEGMEALTRWLTPGSTSMLVGSSGVGKSSLVNALLGEERVRTSEIRQADGRGRHTTTDRQLWQLPSGGLIVDSPGIRELSLQVDQEALNIVFDEIEALARSCRFRDCQHQREPGCAVQAAVAAGELDSSRLASYHKLAATPVLADKQSVQLNRKEQAKKYASMVKDVKLRKKIQRGEF